MTIINPGPGPVDPGGGKVQAVYASSVGIDVHAQVLVCCHQCYDFVSGECREEQASFGTAQSQLREFASWVRERNPRRIIMESTGVLWRSPYEALEDCGFSEELVLANARDVKGKKGHKTDRNDAAHLAVLGRLDAVMGSFVPARSIRNMRLVSRAYVRQKQGYAREKNRKSKYLNAVGTRAGSIFSDVNGKSAREILEA